MILTIDKVHKSYAGPRAGHDTLVLRDVTFTVSIGETVAVMGSNGSGKSTLFRLIAGIENCSAGAIHLPEDDCGSVELMYQDFRATLFPWLSAEHNALCLPASTPEEQSTAHSLLATLAPSLKASAYPSQLSGGEQQAVALIRSLARRASVLLLDEPFVSLDLAMRQRAYAACRNTMERQRVGCLVIATHNIEDAVTLADRILVLSRKPGRVFCQIELPSYAQRSQEGSFGAAVELVRGKLRNAILAQ